MKVALLDRDGTVIVDPPDLRVDKIEKIELFDDSIAALKYLADNDFAVIYATNQAGIEEGRLTEEEFWQIHKEVLSRLSESGVKVLKTYMNGEMKRDGNTKWRKPGPKMLLQAAEDFELDLSQLYYVGDNQSDIDTAQNAGCKGGILVKTANENVESPNAIFTAPRLMDAVKYIVDHHCHMNQIIIDVREPNEFQLSHVAGAINIPASSFLAGRPAILGVAKDTPIVVYCRSGSRASGAKKILEDLGYTKITNGVNQSQVEALYS